MMRRVGGSAIGPIDQLLATWHSPKSPRCGDRVQRVRTTVPLLRDVAELQRFPWQMRVLGSGGPLTTAGMRPPWVDDSLFRSRAVSLNSATMSSTTSTKVRARPAHAQRESNLGQVISSLRATSGLSHSTIGFGLSVAGPDIRICLPTMRGDGGVRRAPRALRGNAGRTGLGWPIDARGEQRPEVFRGLVIGNTFGWPVNGDMHFESSRT